MGVVGAVSFFKLGERSTFWGHQNRIDCGYYYHCRNKYLKKQSALSELVKKHAFKIERGAGMIKHKNIRSKMKKTRALLAHPILAEHVPETVWYNSLNLKDMLARYRSIYIKPDSGFQGRGVLRLKQVDEINGVLSNNDFSKNIILPNVSLELESNMLKKKYIIQQAIDLATYKDCPFDLRLVMQKPYATWELTLTSAKVALRKDAVVSNVAKGAQEYPLNDILQNYDQKQEPMATLRELVNLAHQICSILGSRFPFRIIGLDMAIDKKGRVWFIEANTRPQCGGLKQINDEISYQKYKKARQIIRGRGSSA